MVPPLSKPAIAALPEHLREQKIAGAVIIAVMVIAVQARPVLIVHLTVITQLAVPIHHLLVLQAPATANGQLAAAIVMLQALRAGPFIIFILIVPPLLPLKARPAMFLVRQIAVFGLVYLTQRLSQILFLLFCLISPL